MQDLIDRIYNFWPCADGRLFLYTVTSVEDGLSRAGTEDLRWLASKICKGSIPDHTAHEKLNATLDAANKVWRAVTEAPREVYRQELRRIRDLPFRYELEKEASNKYLEDTKEAREAYEKASHEAFALFNKESREECIAIIRKWVDNG